MPILTWIVNLGQAASSAAKSATPAEPGLEWEAPQSLIHYAAPSERLHYEAPASLLHWTAPKD